MRCVYLLLILKLIKSFRNSPIPLTFERRDWNFYHTIVSSNSHQINTTQAIQVNLRKSEKMPPPSAWYFLTLSAIIVQFNANSLDSFVWCPYSSCSVIQFFLSKEPQNTELELAFTTKGKTSTSRLWTFRTWTVTYHGILRTVFTYLNWWDMQEFAAEKMASYTDTDVCL